MRIFLAAAVIPALAAAIAVPAWAQAPPAIMETPAAVQPIEAAERPAGEDVRTQLLREQLFASGALGGTPARVTRGGAPIDTRSFYRLVGRGDLADRIGSRRAAKGILIGTGATAVTLGFLVGLADSYCFDNCHRQSEPFAGALLIGGAVATLVGIVVPSDPLDAAEKSALIDDYNRRLRAHLGLPAAFETVRRTAAVGAAVHPGGQSGMLGASCAF
jgi:hypothetical protein